MSITIDELNLEKFIVVGDRVLIKPKKQQDRTKSGLYLPPGVHENEPIHAGYVMKVGPGYPIPATLDSDEPWKGKQEEVKYIPIQPQAGDLAVYLQKSGHQIEINREKYVIVPNTAILLLIRDDELFK